MPSAFGHDEDDPVIASYDVYLSAPSSPKSKLFVLQYPAHRPSSKPYNASRSQKPTALRLKPDTGLVELDVPILTQEHYNHDTGLKYGNALSESRTVQAGGTHGVAGGFGTTHHLPSALHSIPTHDEAVSPDVLRTQTLGGKVIRATEQEPVYMLGSLKHNQISLSRLEAVVQLRPQLHHLDAEVDVKQKKTQADNAANKIKPGIELPSAKVESKAIEIKIKDTKDNTTDRNLNSNARLLRDIQAEPWRTYNWVDEDSDTAEQKFDNELHIRHSSGEDGNPDISSIPILISAISNGDWLDKMSAPREDGKKGLLAKLRGRERERARRKKAEQEKRLRSKDAEAKLSNSGPLLEMSEDSELSSLTSSDEDDAAQADEPSVEVVDPADVDIAIKDELALAAAPATLPVVSDSAVQPKRRGRPKKNQPTIDLTD